MNFPEQTPLGFEFGWLSVEPHIPRVSSHCLFPETTSLMSLILRRCKCIALLDRFPFLVNNGWRLA